MLQINFNVIHFVDLNTLGGVQTLLQTYLNNHKNKNIRHIIYSKYKVNNKLYSFKKIKHIRNIILLLKETFGKKNIIHVHNNLTSKKLIFFYLLNYKVILHEHGSFLKETTFFNKVNIFFSKKILINSNYMKNLFVKKYPYSKNKIKVMYNTSESNIKHKVKKNKKIKSVGFIGRINSFKGADIFVKAANIISNENINFLIAGDGIWLKKIKKIANRNINIRFLGPVKGNFKFISNLDLLIIPSIIEPFGNTYLEAAQVGTPVIAAKSGGLKEIITHKKTGILLKPKKYLTEDYLNDIDFSNIYSQLCKIDKKQIKLKIISEQCLAQAINDLLFDQRLLNSLSKDAYVNFQKKFSSSIFIRKINDIYFALIKK